MADSVEDSHLAWRGILYQPAIKAHYPQELLPHLTPGATVLDLGCGEGLAACFLAERGARVVGWDLNAEAIGRARQQALRRGLAETTSFFVGDALDAAARLPSVDAVLMIRVLTCLPRSDASALLQERALAALRPGGLAYVHDFAAMPESAVYGPRYKEGLRRGWRHGSFPVLAADGQLLFVAHHHSEPEVDAIRAPYASVHYLLHESRSLHGNPCRMFEFVGRKVGGAGAMEPDSGA